VGDTDEVFVAAQEDDVFGPFATAVAEVPVTAVLAGFVAWLLVTLVAGQVSSD
jgi:hypothetical protein